VNILYTNFHPRNGGGHVTYIMNLIRGLIQSHNITLATPGSSRLYRYAAEFPDVKRVDMSFPGRVTELAGPAKALRKLIKEQAFDVIHVNGSSDHKLVMLATIGLSPKPRIIFTKHNDHKINSIGNWIRSALATHATIGVSQFVAEMLRRSPYQRHPVKTVRHGIDTDYFAPVSEAECTAFRAQLLPGSAEHKIVLGSSGGTDDDKGWLDLAGALALLSPATRSRFHVVVIGDPPSTDQVARLESIGVEKQFSFPGLVDDVRPWLAACDVGFVLSYREALSFACRELMSQGLPVIVTRVGGLPENLTDREEGWIVPVRDSSAIAEILNTMASDNLLLETMGERARSKALTDFNLPKFVTETLAVYNT